MGTRRQERVFYLVWNHSNHEMALGMLWIRLLSNPCIFLFRCTSVIVLFFGKNYLMFMTLKSFRLCSFPFSNRSFHFVHHIENKCQKAWVHFESPNPQTLIGFYTWLDYPSEIQTLHRMGQYDVTVKTTYCGADYPNSNPSKVSQGNVLILFSLFTSPSNV